MVILPLLLESLLPSLSTDPWWTPTFTSNSVLYPCFVLTTVLALLYIVITVWTSLSSIPSCLNAHLTTSLGTLSNAFSKSTNAKNKSFLFSKNFSCNCLTMKIISTVPLPGINPNCMSSIFTFCLSLFSKTCFIDIDF